MAKKIKKLIQTDDTFYVVEISPEDSRVTLKYGEGYSKPGAVAVSVKDYDGRIVITSEFFNFISVEYCDAMAIMVALNELRKIPNFGPSKIVTFVKEPRRAPRK